MIPQENADDDVQSATKSMAELYARRAALSMTATIVKTVTALLAAARESVDGEKGLRVLDLAPVTTMLMPHVFASISNLVRSDPHCAVQVLSLIQDMLPSVASLNNLAAQNVANGDAAANSDDEMDNAGNQTVISPPSTPHYAWVESEHPYKPASVNTYRVSFPESVQWMSVEFDPRCGTAQMEDVLQIHIRNPTFRAPSSQSNLQTSSAGGLNRSGSVISQSPSSKGGAAATPTNSLGCSSDKDGATVHHHHAAANATIMSGPTSNAQMYTPVLKKLTGSSGWPTQAVVLPGSEVMFSLESASDYVKDDKKTNRFGFRCLVVGYEAVSRREHGLQGLEMELSYLGGLCSSSLMKRNLQLTQV